MIRTNRNDSYTPPHQGKTIGNAPPHLPPSAPDRVLGAYDVPKVLPKVLECKRGRLRTESGCVIQKQVVYLITLNFRMLLSIEEFEMLAYQLKYP